MKLIFVTTLALVSVGAVLAAPAPAPASPVIKRDDGMAPDKAGPAGPMYTFPCTDCGHGANEMAWPPCCQSLGGTPVSKPVVKRGDDKKYPDSKPDNNKHEPNKAGPAAPQYTFPCTDCGHGANENAWPPCCQSLGPPTFVIKRNEPDKAGPAAPQYTFPCTHCGNTMTDKSKEDAWPPCCMSSAEEGDTKSSKPSDKNWNNEPSKAGPAAPQYTFPCTRCGDAMSDKAKEDAWPPCCMSSAEEDNKK